jgi:PelA/Pel-15E family pectate lyase
MSRKYSSEKLNKYSIRKLKTMFVGKTQFLSILGMISFVLAVAVSPASAEVSTTVDEAESSLKKAVQYFRGTVSTNGGYLWTYSADLKKRHGEGKATETQIWVQPPGTPAVGFAYLRAYEATGDEFYLEAAKAAADALVWGQLESGGWDYKIDFSPNGSRKWYYRRDKSNVNPKSRRNTSTFDDNTSQSALRFIMSVHKTTGEEKYLSAVEYGLNFMLKSQFENGAWPQRYPLASKGYSRWYTFNDNTINDCIKVMLDAYHIYGDGKYLESAKRGGDFIIAAQLPEPQAGWAQQYDYDMNPAPARWFEPAAVCAAATGRNIKTLINLYLETGAEKYLDPIPAAINWLEKSRLNNGQWARFYELETNNPIYVNMDREVVYEFVNIRPGYSWRGNYASSAIRLYNKIKKLGREKYLLEQNAPLTAKSRRRRLIDLEPKVRGVIAKQDAQGRWVDDGEISCSTFIKNVRLLSDYIALAREVFDE